MPYIPIAAHIGDSLTQGVGGAGRAWRGPMYTALKAAGTPYFAQGLVNDGSATEDPYHDGNGGNPIANAQSITAQRIAQWLPDILTMEAGTIDISSSSSAPTVLTALSAWLDVAWLQNRKPWLQVLLFNILRRTDSVTFNNVAIAVNQGMAGIVAGKTFAANITIVDWYPIIIDSDLTDGIHINDTGYARVAATIGPKYMAPAIARVISDPRRFG